MNEIELLFTDILGCQRHQLYLNKYITLDTQKRSILSEALIRRQKGEPLQYILGKTEFMGLEFKLNCDVFIPRPETEILVETALKIGDRLQVIGHRLKVLDIGTGCGNIAITIAKTLSYCEVDALDISDAALEIASENARLNKVKVNFIKSDLFNNDELQPDSYDLILSNPPYIPSKDIDKLALKVRYEPWLALDGGKDGLDFYRRIIKESSAYLKEYGYLIMEMGYGQGRAIKNMFKNSDRLEIIDMLKDYNNIDRLIVGEKKRWIS